nr:hypothetical protein [Tanacetum cinerariifolium]
MKNENPIRTLGDYSKPSQEGYRNTIELTDGNNVVPLRSDTIREMTHLRLIQFFLRNQASNWLERLPAGSLLNSFHQEGLLNSKITSLPSNNIMANLSLKHRLVLRTYSKKSLIMVSIFGSKSKSFMTMSIPPQGEPSTNRSEICSGSHDNQYCMDNPEQAFVEYVSLATANAMIDYRKAKIAVGEGITMSIFGVKEISLDDEEIPYWTTLGKRESYEPRPSTDDVGIRPLFYVKKDFVEHHLPWKDGDSEFLVDSGGICSVSLKED